MGCDFSELRKTIGLIAEAFGLFTEAIKEAWEIVKPGILKFYEMLQEVEYEEKSRFKPVLKIVPNKVNYPNKRLINHYCRNSC